MIRYMSAQSDAEEALVVWREEYQRLADTRDQLILRALRANVPIRRISLGLGVSRSTVYRLLAESEAGE